MRTPHPDWLAARVVHLTGGCRAYNNFDPLLVFEPALASGHKVQMEFRAYNYLYAHLKTADLASIGFDFVTDPTAAVGLVPADWRPYHHWPTSVWPCQDEIDRWSQIGYAGGKAKNARLWDISRRVSHQLRVCAWRLRQISESYREQLHARTATGTFRAGTRFEDGYTWLCYLAIQAFLIDACVLRDYLAEFYSMYCCPEPDLISGLHITSMSGLKKQVIDKLSSTNQITDEFRSAIKKGGWLHLLGAYRDLVVHCVPLARSDSSLVALSTELIIREVGSLPAVSLPLPENPSAISKSWASGEHLASLEDELSFFVNANRGSAPSTDGLIYAHACLGNLTKLVMALGKHAPLRPEIPHFTDDDINGEINFTRK